MIAKTLNKKSILEFIKYFLGACIGIGVDWLFWLLVFKCTQNPYLAQGTGRLIGACVAFYLFKNHVFQDAMSAKNEKIKFIMVAGISWCISLSLTSLGLVFFIPLVAKIISDGVTFIMNWFVMKFWVFKK